MTRPLAFVVAAILISGWLSLIYGQSVITNPPGNQTVSQPPGTFLAVNRFTASGVIVIPNGGAPPTGGCRNGSLFLQRISSMSAVPWGCSQGAWVRLWAELNPHTDRSTATNGQMAVSITQSMYLPASLHVFRNGLLEDGYSASGTVVTFNFPLSAGDKIVLSYLAP